MVSVIGLVLFGVVLLVHTLVAAVTTRFRLRLKTQWGYVIYSFLVIPVVLLATSLVFFGVLGIDGGLDLRPPAFLGVAIGLPLALGFTIDTLYVPAPEEYDLPERT